jgi:hypothetical protein
MSLTRVFPPVLIVKIAWPLVPIVTAVSAVTKAPVAEPMLFEEADAEAVPLLVIPTLHKSKGLRTPILFPVVKAPKKSVYTV